MNKVLNENDLDGSQGDQKVGHDYVDHPWKILNRFVFVTLGS